MTRDRVFAAVVLSAAFACSAIVSADTIRLKNGNSFEGTVESRSKTEVKILMDGTVVSFRPDEILSIEESQVFSSSATSSDKRAVSKRDSARRKIGQERKAGRRRTAGAAKTEPGAWPKFNLDHMWLSQVSKKLDVSGRLGALDPSSPPAIAMAFAVFFVLLFHLVCIYGVAKRTGTGHAWMVWIPFLQGIPVCWMGGFSIWWLLGFLVAVFFHPLVALAAYIIFWVLLVGPGIARACEKPWWIGPFLFLYPLAFLVWAYLAFAPEKKKPKVVLPPGFKLPS